jgi:hypothetical protein
VPSVERAGADGIQVSTPIAQSMSKRAQARTGAGANHPREMALIDESEIG